MGLVWFGKPAFDFFALFFIFMDGGRGAPPPFAENSAKMIHLIFEPFPQLCELVMDEKVHEDLLKGERLTGFSDKDLYEDYLYSLVRKFRV